MKTVWRMNFSLFSGCTLKGLRGGPICFFCPSMGLRAHDWRAH